MKKNYEEQAVVNKLNEKQDISIRGKVIECMKMPHAKCDVGIHSKGKIDFLTNHCGYTLNFVTKFS